MNSTIGIGVWYAITGAFATYVAGNLLPGTKFANLVFADIVGPLTLGAVVGAVCGVQFWQRMCQKGAPTIRSSIGAAIGMSVAGLLAFNVLWAIKEISSGGISLGEAFLGAGLGILFSTVLLGPFVVVIAILSSWILYHLTISPKATR